MPVDVDTHNKVVTLSGEVDTQAQRTHAVMIARNTDGVADVIDELRVNPTAATSGIDVDADVDVDVDNKLESDVKRGAEQPPMRPSAARRRPRKARRRPARRSRTSSRTTIATPTRTGSRTGLRPQESGLTDGDVAPPQGGSYNPGVAKASAPDELNGRRVGSRAVFPTISSTLSAIRRSSALTPFAA